MLNILKKMYRFKKTPKNIALKTKSHYHITLKDIQTQDLSNYAKLIKGKPTSIDLIIDKEKPFKDRMLTKHQLGHSLLPLFTDVLTLQKSGAEIARYKLELDLNDIWEDLKQNPENFQMVLSEQNYIELHIKVPNDFPLLEKTYKNIKIGISKNPKTQNHYFYNLRLYNQKDLKTGLEFLKKIENIGKDLNFPPINIHKEYTLFDSHLKHDKNWL